jgi:dolichol-phosphate mannosyltransferase
LAALNDADLVLGSRWVPGGRVLNWPRSWQILSRVGNAYARLMLGLPLRDATGGYRAYRAAALREIGLEDVESRATASKSTSP